MPVRLRAASRGTLKELLSKNHHHITVRQVGLGIDLLDGDHLQRDEVADPVVAYVLGARMEFGVILYLLYASSLFSNREKLNVALDRVDAVGVWDKERE
jgi:hypothetical protein